MGVLRAVSGLTVLVVLIGVMALPADAAGLLVPRNGSSPIEVKSHRVTVTVTDGLAKTTLRQTFVNPHSRALEAIYLFPVPTDAALVDLAMEVGGQRLEGLLAERKQARRVYDQIVRQRRDPALVEQVGRNAFRLSVFPLLPGVDTIVELTWIERIPLSQGVFRYTYPLLTKGKAATTEQDFTFTLTFNSSVPFTSVTSPVEGMDIVTKAPGEVVASFELSKATLDRDVTVEARVEVEKPTLTVSTFRGNKGDGWFMAVLTPPPATGEQLVPRDVILVLDTSGSMKGSKIEQAKASARFLLENLRPTDRVNIMRFSSTTEAFARSPVPATKKNLEKLREFVDGLTAGGGTAIGDALATAVRVPAIQGRVRTVVFLTDGLPTVGEKNPAKLVRLARSGSARGLRVFTFGVGRDVNPALLEGIAKAGRGRAEIFRPQDEVSSRLNAFLTRTASPVIADLEMAVEGLETFELFPRPVPDAYLGEQVVLLGRYRGGGEKWVSLSAVVGTRKTTLSTLADFRESAGGSLAVAHLFAREKMAFLELALRLRTGLDDEAYYAALDRGAYTTEDEIVEEIINVSLEHGVQSAYTSLIALLPEDRRRINPRNAEELAQAMERASKAKAALAPEVEPTPEGTTVKKAAKPKELGRRYMGPGPSASPGSGISGGRGPAGEVPPGHRDPKDPQPPGHGPMGSGPATPPPPNLPGPVGPPPGGPIATPGGMVARPLPMTFENWIFWWAHEKDRVAAAIAPPRVVPEEVRERIRPALRQVIRNGKAHPAIREMAIFALARSGGGAGFVDGCMERATISREYRIVNASLLALGMRETVPPPVIEFLRSYLVNDRNSAWSRCYAALALGLLGDRPEETFVALRSAVGSAEPESSLPHCALVALGLIGDQERTAEMLGWLETGKIGDQKLDDSRRAYLISALGRMGDPMALGPVAGTMRRKGLHSRRSAAIALADLAAAVDPATRLKTLKKMVAYRRNARDRTVLNFLTIAIGRLGMDKSSPDDLNEKCRLVLCNYFENGGKQTDRPYASLALGLCGGEREERLLRETLGGLRGNMVSLGAQAVALGLLGTKDPETVGLLEKIARDRGLEAALRGGAIVALGLIGDDAPMGWVRKALSDRRERHLRADLAFAIGLQRDAAAVPALLAILTHNKTSESVLMEVAAALGRIGGESAIPKLIEILEPEKVDGVYPDLTRLAAAVALGRIAAGGGDGGLSRIAFDHNYRCTAPVLEEVLRIP